MGCFVASYLTSGLGRRKTIMVVCGIALVGMIMQAAIPNYWGLMAGRLVNAVSMGMMSEWNVLNKADNPRYRSKHCTNVHG